MEDSYIVHRRRKAAARRREKTPDPSSRNQLVESSEDEEDTRRARMEKMADEAEQQEMENKMKLEVPSGDVEMKEETRRKESPKKEIKAAMAEDTSRRMSGHEDGAGTGPRTRESDTGEDAGRSVKKETSQTEGGSSTKEASKREDPVKERPQESPIRPKETVGTSRPEAKREKRVKKKSKERLERHSRSTDSSDAEEYEKSRHPRRTKSPEEGKIRAKKSSAKRSSVVDSDGAKKTDSEKGTREKRSSSRQKLEDSEDQTKDRSEKRQSRRHSQPNTDEEPKMRKSESFPIYSSEGVAMKRSSTEVKKQIIPLSNDSLIQDFAKAQREYLRREQSILDPDPPEVFEDAQEQTALRRRKISVKHSETEKSEILESIDRSKDLDKRSWSSWLSYFRRKEEKQPPQEVTEKHKNEETKLVELDHVSTGKVTLMDFLRALKDVVAEFKAFVEQNPRETRIIIRLRNHCISELILMIIYCGLGAFVFRFTEGAFETFYKCGVKRVKRDFLDSLWNYSHNMREEDWKSMARRKLMEFEEQLHTAHEAGVHSYSGQRSWSFLNSVVYCLTVITTIGYGHISPSTTTGRAITIVYAIFGIPMFLIILADFGKLFTRGIKFLWAFVRRLYYTGSCRSVRRTVPVQEVMKGVQLVYDFATFRRPSQINPEDIEEMQKQAQQSQTVLNLDGNVPDTPGTPAMSAFAIDDEFNLPISVAIFILLGYIFVGATLYYISEDWGFFESFYFVFISMSTIGFGDFVPKQPTYMVCSIVYLVFGLALTSMCINVVQVMLSDSFRQASQKIGATIGFEIAEEDRSVNPAPPPPIEVADVHASIKESESVEKIAPKAKQEDIDL